MGQDEDFDVIVIGLGVAGLSTVYHASKRGLKVLGLERNVDVGLVGTSSAGATRAFRLEDPFAESLFPGGARAMHRALELFRELEKESGRHLVVFMDEVEFGRKDSDDFMAYMKGLQGVDKEDLSGAEIMERYPAFRNLGQEHIGFVRRDAGVIKANEVLHALKEVSLANGARLEFGQDCLAHSQGGLVRTTDRLTGAVRCFQGADVVRCTGIAIADEPVEVETYTFCSNEGFPSVFGDFCHFPKIFYGLRDGEDLSKFKVAFHGRRDFDAFVRYMNERLQPQKHTELVGANPCFYSYTADGSFSYGRVGDEVRVSACMGEGFKYAMLHGEKALEVVSSSLGPVQTE
mmetsp:Transcript_22162/g.66291  ORF Transcript_22162/g.66291 Transcript_22162/m.66291 type:complete len:347 (-) Transcript_22162:231-1271(-)